MVFPRRTYDTSQVRGRGSGRVEVVGGLFIGGNPRNSNSHVCDSRQVATLLPGFLFTTLRISVRVLVKPSRMDTGKGKDPVRRHWSFHPNTRTRMLKVRDTRPVSISFRSLPGRFIPVFRPSRTSEFRFHQEKHTFLSLRIPRVLDWDSVTVVPTRRVLRSSADSLRSGQTLRPSSLVVGLTSTLQDVDE